jgi:pimeloyl-ACP methyl ester carboxylesterase
MRQVRLGGRIAAIHVDEPGSPNGIDVVLVHGAGFDHTAWRYQTRFLAGRGYRTLAPDLPGHGGSEGPSLGSIEEMAEWLGELLSVSGVEQPVLVGHSMGSYIALATATSSPGSARALVLLGASDRMRVHPELLDASARQDHHAIDLMIGWMHTGHNRYGGHRSAGSWIAGTSRRILECNLGSLGSDLAACEAFDPALIGAMPGCPTLIVSGADDKMTSSRAAERLHVLLGSEEHVVLDGAGHMALVERAEDIDAALVRFLSRATAAASPDITAADG